MADHSELAVFNAHVFSMDPFDRQEANALAITNSRFCAVREWVEKGEVLSKNTRVIDANGGTLLPRFIDSHVHVTHYARYRKWVNCDACDSVASLVEMVRNESRGISLNESVDDSS